MGKPDAASSQTVSAAQFVLLLHCVPHLGEKSLARLLRLVAQNRLDPAACLGLSARSWQNDYDLHPLAAAHLAEQSDALRQQSAELARTARAHALHVLTLASAAYPARLERFDDAPPPILYGLGRLSLLEGGPDAPTGYSVAPAFAFTIAVSNGAAPDVLTRQDELADGLVRAGGIPVTGHDRPPYKRLALSAQRLNRPTLYVLDRGLREALGPQFDRPPFAAARIRDAVFEISRDLALSPFRLDDHSLGANNKRRDRLIFALADVVIALDVRAGGGMAGECRRAWAQGKAAYVAPIGRDGNDALRAAGCPSLPDSTDWAAQIAARAQARPK